MGNCISANHKEKHGHSGEGPCDESVYVKQQVIKRDGVAVSTKTKKIKSGKIPSPSKLAEKPPPPNNDS